MNIYGASPSREKFKKSTLACIIAGLMGCSPLTLMAAESDCSAVNGTQLICSGATGLKDPNAAELFNPWAKVVIETTGSSADYPGVHDGRGLIFYHSGESIFTSEQFSIKTTGSGASAIQPEFARVIFTGSTSIETTGEAAAGVFLSNRGVSNVTFADNLSVITADGMGLAAEILSTPPENGGGMSLPLVKMPLFAPPVQDTTAVTLTGKIPADTEFIPAHITG